MTRLMFSRRRKSARPSRLGEIGEAVVWIAITIAALAAMVVWG